MDWTRRRRATALTVGLVGALVAIAVFDPGCSYPEVVGKRSARLHEFGRRARFVGSEGKAPNGAPFDAMYFRHTGVNPFFDTEDDPIATFALDVDTASFAMARRYLREGHLPPAEAIRVEEFINAFDYRYPRPRHEDFSVIADGVAVPTGVRRYVVRFGLRARDMSRRERKPARLTFVVDVSGSMNWGNRLGAVKHALGMLLDQLRPDDRVGLVVYANSARVVLEHTADKERIRAAIDELEAGGGTNLEDGLVLAYRLACAHYREGAINRVILCSDGVGNIGRTSADAILARVGKQARRGIELSTVGFGIGNYNDVMLERLADTGDGNYAYVDDEEEARRVFVEHLTGMLHTVGRDARVQVVWNPALVQSYRLIGYENRELRDEAFRDDRVDAGEVGADHQVTALFEIKLVRGADRRVDGNARLATLRLRYETPGAHAEVLELQRELHAGALAPRLEAAPPGLRLALTAAWFAERLRRSPWVRAIDVATLRALAAPLPEAFGTDPAVADLLAMIEHAAALEGEAAARVEGDRDGWETVAR